MIARQQINAALELLNKAVPFIHKEILLRDGNAMRPGSFGAVGVNEDGLPIVRITIHEEPREIGSGFVAFPALKRVKGEYVIGEECIVDSIAGDVCRARMVTDQGLKDVEITFGADPEVAEHFFKIEMDARQVKLGSVVTDKDGSDALVTSLSFGVGNNGSSIFVGLSLNKGFYHREDLALPLILNQGEEAVAFPKYVDISLPKNRKTFGLVDIDEGAMLRTALSRRPPLPPRSPEGGT